MKILKFGGSSVGNPERIKNVIEIIKKAKSEDSNISVVFSAYQGVTDSLVKISSLAAEGKSEYKSMSGELGRLFSEFAGQLLSKESYNAVNGEIATLISELQGVLNGIYLVREVSPKTSDYLLSFGERIAAFTICEALKESGIASEYLDARLLVKTDDNYGAGKVNFALTDANIQSYFKERVKLQVITGFIGSTEKGETITLGRGGSDYTASIFAAALNADEVEIWTDVDGVMTADPRLVKKAFSLSFMTYEEAMELSHFGAKVIFPPTMQPAMNRNIPIRIRNTFKPGFSGTLIAKKNGGGHFPFKGISSIDEISALRVHGSGMIGMSGIAKRIFTALASANINVILITQASSQHSICMALSPKQAVLAKDLIEQELKFELLEKQVSGVAIESDLSVIAVVGENMRKTPGISGKIFQTLGKNGVNVSAIAQGSSDLNISAIIPKADKVKALNALHDTFFLSSTKTINLFVVGTGLVGGTLLEQLREQKEVLEKEYSVDVKVIALANSRKMLFNEEGHNLNTWKDSLLNSGVPTELTSFIETMKKLNLQNSIFIDCTASGKVTEKYLEILKSSISIVSPNKRANSQNYSHYQRLKQTAHFNNVKFFYETNVGAGLPIIGTLKDLVSSGDKIFKIEGVLSGTLSFLFNSFDGTKSFSQIICEAKERGYTEPDPREDLNGIDVARKILILAREAGCPLEFEDIEIENLVPEELRETSSIEEFMARMADWDGHYAGLLNDAKKQDKVLRYVAKFENGKASISLDSVDRTHPLYSLTGGENLVSFTTSRYKTYPLVIKGPGAGADVTAAGVFADVLRVSNYLN